MSERVDIVNSKIDKLIKRVDMELKAEGFDPMNVANLFHDFTVLFKEKMDALQLEEDKKERGF